MRGYFLYLHSPHDRSFWAKLRSPPSLVVLLVSAAPLWSLRAAFFFVLLLLLLPERDEYQLCQYILSLKGTQALTGVAFALQGVAQLYACAVLAQPATCDAEGPGVGRDVVQQGGWICALQLLAWTAFALLPFSSQNGTVGLSILGRRDELRAKRLAKKRNRKAPAWVNRLRGKGDEGVYTDLEADGDGADGAAADDGGKERCVQARHNFADNRLFSLLWWDLLTFLACALLFALLAGQLAAARLQPSGGGADDGGDDGGGVDSPALGDVLALLAERPFWDDWRVQVSFFLVRILLALLALPFLVFELPLLSTLLSHTYATGFDRDGRCVAEDTDGLSMWLDWIGGKLRGRAFRDALTATSADGVRGVEALEAAIDAAAAHTRRTPPLAKHATDALKEKLEEMLLKLAPPGHPRHAECFRERVVAAQYAEAAGVAM